MFTGYKVLITGATAGMGLATAKEFLANGATVIGIGRNFERTKDLGDKFIPFKCDVTDPEQIAAAKAFAEETFEGVLDVLVCNAGAGSDGAILDIKTENLNKAYELHFRNHVLFTREMAPLLKKSKNPSITYTCSVAAFGIIDTGFDYAGMKSAMVSYTRIAACVLDGIRCNAVCPGLIRTNLFPGAVWDVFANDKEVMASIPCHRVGDEWEVAKLFTFLASEKASCVNGAIIAIDGGWNVRHTRVDIMR